MIFKNIFKYKKNKKPRIFIGFVEIAGYYKNLYEGFCQLGLDVCFVNYWEHKFAYHSDNPRLPLVKIINYFVKTLNSPKASKIQIRFSFLALLACETILLAWAIFRFDTFIFGFGTSFYSPTSNFKKFKFVNKELPLLKKLGKKVIFIFNGTDERPPYLDGTLQHLALEDLALFAQEKRKSLEYIEKYADYIVSNPLSSQFHKKNSIMFTGIGLPYNPPTNLENKKPTQFKNNKLTILHCPSDLLAKGTELIRAVINELKIAGYVFDYIEISGKPNIEVINAIQEADFIIDQLFSDTPMAGLALEAAWFGKPTIITGYEIEELKLLLGKDNTPPTLNAYPEQLKDLIILLLEDGEFRKKLGSQAQNFVRKNWAAKEVAKRYLSIIQGHVPAYLCFDPNQYSFSGGCGLTKQKKRQNLKNLYEMGGGNIFQVNDKPLLKEKFLNELNMS